MSAESISQARLARLAKHHPEKIYKKNRGILRMKGVELSKYAETPDKGLPYKKKKRRSK